MARNEAMRKAAKAAKRKAVVAEKRKQDHGANSLSGRIRENAGLPILQCLISDQLFEAGMGSLVLMRGLSVDYTCSAVFLLDTFCLGVKNTDFGMMDRDQTERYLEIIDDSDPHSPIAPEEGRKLLRDLAAWSEGNGFPQYKDYAALEKLFGTVVPAETDYTPRFGKDGKVLYIPGPTDTPALIRRRMAILRERHGDDGHFILPLTGNDPFGDPEDDDAVILDGEAEEIADTAPAA